MRGNPKAIHIGVDLLGSDASPRDLLEGVLLATESLPDHVHLVFFGLPSLFEAIHPPRLNVVFQPVEEVISMEEAPLAAIRKKRHSSLCMGIRGLKEGRLQAFISAGNTGALLASAKIELPSLPGVERPALMTLLPTKEAEMAILDVGANTTCQAEHLIQFALMGVAYQKCRGVLKPRVGLLNIGAEAKKGTPELQQAYLQLQQMAEEKGSFHFAGNIEGRDAFLGRVDVLVTDGFTGNVFLKTAEGVAALILEELEAHHEILPEVRARLHYTEYPGALLAGVEEIVMKCHGNVSPLSIGRTITIAARLVQHQFLDQLKRELFV
jgi:glycerol-3-phosphate acyltransferase PlsX